MHELSIFCVELLEGWLNGQLLVWRGRQHFELDLLGLQSIDELSLGREQEEESISF